MNNDKNILVSLVSRDLFVKRALDNEELAGFLYDQMKALLDLFGEETDDNTLVDVLIFSYREAGQSCTKYWVSEEFAEIIKKHFKHSLKDAVEEYGKANRVLGSDVLHQLNRGEISMADFADKITKT